MKKYHLLVFIGRFQPLHLSHQEVIESARSLAENVLVLVGSANSPRSVRNPFTFDERKEMINSIFPDVIVRPIADHTYNDTGWMVQVQDVVKDVALELNNPNKNVTIMGMKDLKIGVIGCDKDESTYYLHFFKDWAYESHEARNPLHATGIRHQFFVQEDEHYYLETTVGHTISNWLSTFRRVNADYEKLAAEAKYIHEYKKKYGKGPFLTADALVQVGGKILLIRRGKEYGHGLLAMPGGFLNDNERFETAMLRELREETRLRVPSKVLLGSVVSRRVFDDPHRSARARLVTETFHINLRSEAQLPEVRGGDDADEALWVNISDLNEKEMFEDHYHIIKVMLGLS